MNSLPTNNPKSSEKLEDILQTIIDKSEAKPTQENEWLGRCPAHKDTDPSLSITYTPEKILIHCHAGCSFPSIAAALGLEEEDFFKPNEKSGGKKNPWPGTLTLEALSEAKRIPIEKLKKLGCKTETDDYWGTFVSIPYYDINKNVVSIQRRLFLKTPNENAKRFIWRKGDKAVAYGMQFWKRIIEKKSLTLVEGASDSWTLWLHDYLAIGLPGAANAKNLKGIPDLNEIEKIYYIREPDSGGESFAKKLPLALKRKGFNGSLFEVSLNGAKDPSELYLQSPEQFKRNFQAALDAAKEIELPALEFEPKNFGKSEQPKTAEILVAIAKPTEKIRTTDERFYVSVSVNNHQETYPIRSKNFRSWLTHEYLKNTGLTPNSEAMQQALGTIEAFCMFEGKREEVFIRVAPLEGKIFIDLCNDKWEAIEVSSKGWKVVSNPPVRFRRTKGMKALPYPVRGDISALRQFVNIKSEEDFTLILAWLVAALRPDSIYPVLLVIGEQGSAKSTTARILRALVDPNTSPLRTISREERDLMISANSGWVMVFDNLSGVQPWLSDALCRIATGGGFSTRTLYSDEDETLFTATRPIILTGIADVVSRPDLLDRCSMISLEPISEEKRLEERTFWTNFEKVKPAIFGGLLDALSAALRNIDSTTLNRLPRMADFAKWASAAESGLGLKPGAFMAAYDRNRSEAVELNLEGDLVASAIRELLKADDAKIQGTASELLKELEILVEDKVKNSKDWPKNARSISCKLRYLSTNLRAIGIEVTYQKRNEKQRLITLTRKSREICVRNPVCVMPDTETLESQPLISMTQNSEIPDAKLRDKVLRHAQPSFASYPQTVDNKELIDTADANDANDGKIPTSSGSAISTHSPARIRGEI